MNTEQTLNSQPQTSVSTFTNREMAAVLFNIATVLRQSGNTNPFRTAAYERGARALMGLRHEVCDVLGSQEKVSFRRRQHIGKKLHAKIQEMARSGALGQYEAMLQDLPRHQRQLMLVPGIGPKTADLLYAATGIEQTADLVRAAREGRLRRVRGFGPKRTAQIAALPLPEDAAASRQLSLF